MLTSNCANQVTCADSLSRMRPPPSNSMIMGPATTAGISTSTNRV